MKTDQYQLRNPNDKIKVCIKNNAKIINIQKLQISSLSLFVYFDLFAHKTFSQYIKF